MKSWTDELTVDGIGLPLGAGARFHADYFETCRRKRIVIDYTRSHVATASEDDEIITKATEFCELVESWIALKFPNLTR